MANESKEEFRPTPQQQKDIQRMRKQGIFANGASIGVFIVLLCIVIFDDRGWGAALISAIVCLWVRHQLLPIRPQWLEREMRKR
jgi:hypothetical protein